MLLNGWCKNDETNISEDQGMGTGDMEDSKGM